MKLRVMTFNIQHGLRHDLKPAEVIDLAAVGGCAAAEAPDFVGFEEVRGAGTLLDYTDQIGAIGACLPGMTGYFGQAIDFAAAGAHAPYGNAFLTRLLLREVETVPIPDPVPRRYHGYYETRCVVRAVAECEGQPVLFLLAHFGLNPDEQENAVQTVLALACKTALPAVLLGDFNMKPDNPLIARLRAEFTDTGDFLLAGDGFTFPSDCPDRKIDYIFARGFRVRSAEVVRKVVSDHCPLSAVLESDPV